MILLGRGFDSVFGSSVLVMPGPYVYFWIIDGILLFYRHGKQKATVPGTKREVGGATIERMTCNNKREQ